MGSVLDRRTGGLTAASQFCGVLVVGGVLRSQSDLAAGKQRGRP
jgi:hypothetical protein